MALERKLIAGKMVWIRKAEKLSGGKGGGLTVEDIANKHKVSVSKIKEQLKMGIKVESEHTKDKKLQKEIALDHLEEMPDYYTKLAEMENKKSK